MPFTIIRQDITKMRVDAIVSAVGFDKFDSVMPGKAVITRSFLLSYKYVIHTVDLADACWSEQLLRSAYVSSLQLAAERGCMSVAFPLITCGDAAIFKGRSFRVATAAITGFLADHDMDVYLVVTDTATFISDTTLLDKVACYIDEQEKAAYLQQQNCQMSPPAPEAFDHAEFDMPSMSSKKAPTLHKRMSAAPSPALSIADIIDDLDEPFSATLLRLIDEKGMTDTEVYKRANIDRRLFSKIRSGKSYTPGKRTILALAVSLKLTLPETDDLLKRAGLALSHSQKFDVIVEYFIVNKLYDIFAINEVLFRFDQALLGG